MFIVKHRKFFFALSSILVIGSIAAIFVYGFHLGIDFNGGSMYEVNYPYGRPDATLIQSRLNAIGLGTYTLASSGQSNFILKMREVSTEEKGAVTRALSDSGNFAVKEIQFTSIGPTVGSELARKAVLAIVAVIICIVLFITFAFRYVSHPVPSWKYGLATIIALAHDVIIPTGVFIVWSHFRGGEIDLLFVTALLAILGYSVHDTIVVFDRVRENLRNAPKPARLNDVSRSGGGETFEQTVGKSVTQTFGRSINTSFTIFLAIVALYFVGGASTKDFAFVLLIGIIAGTYSSIFVASPLLVTLEKMQKH